MARVTRAPTPVFDALGILVAGLFTVILVLGYFHGGAAFPLTLLLLGPFVPALAYERMTRVRELDVDAHGLAVARALGAKRVAWNDLRAIVLAGMDRIVITSRGPSISLDRARYEGDFDGVARALLEEAYRREIPVKTPATLGRSAKAQLAAWQQRLDVVPRARVVDRERDGR